MTGYLARISARKPFTVIAIWIVAVVVAGLLAIDGEMAPGLAPLTDLLDPATTSEFRLSNSAESVRAEALLHRLRGAQRVTEVVVVRSETVTVDSPEFRAKVETIHADLLSLGSETLTSAFHYYQTNEPSLVSADRQATIMPLFLSGSIDEAVADLPALLLVVQEADGSDGFRVLMVGEASAAHEYGELAESDLRWGERVGIPLALVILLGLFGTVVAALVPIGLSVACIIVALGLTALIGQVFDLIFLVTLMVVMIGLAVGIDYSLLVVSRFRDELARGLDKHAAIERAGARAGGTVLFSGVTVVVALCGLLIVPFPFFRSLGLGAILVVLVSLAATLTLLPAVLTLLGSGVDRLPIPFLGRVRSASSGSWGRRFWGLATRAPVISIIVVAAPMVAATVLYFQIHTGINGVDSFPEGSQARDAFFVMEEHFSFGVANPTEIVIHGDVGSPQLQQTTARLEALLRADGRFLVPDAPSEVNPERDLTLLTIIIPGEPRSREAIDVVTTVRDDYVPAAFEGVEAEVLVGGVAAESADFYSVIGSYTPAVFAFVLGLSFLILMVVFRSVVVPIKAVLMNLLSVGAAFGMVVLVFQKGVATGMLGFQRVEVIDVWIPLLMFAILFGLSMDYHVFLLSRIRERYDETGDNAGAVTYGLRSTAGMITGAALIMVAVFGAFASGETVINQQLGFGLAFAITLDATLVRSVLLPATMAALGRANWYLPSWLGWLPDLRVEVGESRC